MRPNHDHNPAPYPNPATAHTLPILRNISTNRDMHPMPTQAQAGEH